MKRVITALLALPLLAGCGNLRAIHFNDGLRANRALMVDSNQRGVITGDFSDARAVCAEPAPDTTSAMALAASANISRSQAEQLQAALAMSESTMNIGLRTPTIQLLRDGMYRLCEAYMNGAIDQPRYAVLINRYQQMMIGLVAIEQLTGVVRTSQNRISAGQATTTASLSVQRVDALAQQSRIEERIAALNERLDEIGNPPDAAEGESQDIRNRRAERDRLNAQLTVWVSALDAQTKAVAALSQATPTPTTSEAEAGEGADGAGNDPSESHAEIAEHVSEAVYWITNDITSGNLSEFMCLPASEILFPGTEVDAQGRRIEAANLTELQEFSAASCLQMAVFDEVSDYAEQQRRTSETPDPEALAQRLQQGLQSVQPNRPHATRPKGQRATKH